MFAKFRLLFLALVPAAALVAQETPAPGASPTPAATPSPAPEVAPTPTPAPAPSATPEPSPSPAADVIPLEGVPSLEGAPLDTTDILPPVDQLMPDDAFVDPNALIPDEAPPPPPSISQAAESAEARLREINIRYRNVRVQVEKDPQVMSLLAQADEARTMEDRRAAFREYYRLLFKKIVAKDKTLAERCQQLEAAYLRRLAQEMIEPTIPLKPPPTPEPLR